MIIPLAEPKISTQDIEIVSKQIGSTFIGPGKASEEFAQKIALASNRKYAVPLASGTIALTIAAKSLGLRAEDEIIIPCYGVISVINAFASLGLNIKLVDIDKKTGCINPQKLEKAISPKTKAVCFINFLGSIGTELDEVAKICKKNNIYLIEDAAWSLGRKATGKTAGSIGDISITSFSVPKIISTGQGGAIMTDSPEVKDKIIEFIDQGGLDWRKTNNIKVTGSNLRMSDINASLGISQIDDLENRHKSKSDIFLKINEILEDNLVKASDGSYPYQNVIFIENRDEALNQIREKGILAAKQYSLYNALTPYQNISVNESFEGGNFWDKHAIYLPFGIGTKSEIMEEMAQKIKDLNLKNITK